VEIWWIDPWHSQRAHRTDWRLAPDGKSDFQASSSGGFPYSVDKTGGGPTDAPYLSACVATGTEKTFSAISHYAYMIVRKPISASTDLLRQIDFTKKKK
jgi:hypothetical protein